MNPPSSKRLLLLFALAVCIFKLALIGRIALSPDEAYYWTWSMQPAAAYFDQPGMTAWVNWLGNHVPGAPSPFSVRLPAVLLAMLATLFAFFCSRELFREEREALVFAIGFALTPIFFLSGMVMIHDSVLIFFLAGFYYFCSRLLKRPSALTWLGLTLFLLGSLYSKFNALFAALGLAIYLPVSPLGRTLLRRPWPWLSGTASILGFWPALLWNRQRGWPSVLAVQQLTARQNIYLLKRLQWFFEYAASQFGVYSPLLFVSMLAAVIWGILLLRKKRDERILLMLCLSLPALLYFLVQSLRSHVFGNWSIVGYFPLLLLAARLSMSGAGRGKILNRRFFLAGVWLAAVISLSAVSESKLRLLRPLSWELKDRLKLPRQPDFRLDMELEGWDELRDFVARNRRPGELIACRRYQVASILEFMLPDHPVPVVISRGVKQSQFNLWQKPSELAGRWMLFADTSPLPEAVKKEFASVEPLAEPLWIYRQNHPVKKFYIYRAYDYEFSQSP